MDSRYSADLRAQALSTAGPFSIAAANDVKFSATLSIGTASLFSLTPASLSTGCAADPFFCSSTQTTGNIAFDEVFTVLAPSLDDFKGVGQFSIRVEELSTYSALLNDVEFDFSSFGANWAGSIAVTYTYMPTLVPVPETSTLSLFALGLGIISVATRRRRTFPSNMQADPLSV